MHSLSRQRLHLVRRIAMVRTLDRAMLHRSAESLAESRRVLREADRCLLHLHESRLLHVPASTMAMPAEAAETRQNS